MKFLSKVILFIFLTSCATLQRGAVFIGEVTDNETLVKAAGDMTPQQEYYLGRSIVAKVVNAKPIHEKKSVQAYVNFIGQYLAYHSDRPDLYVGYRFVVVDENVPSAMSAPGGYVIISKAMVELTKNEDELAAVLAHEVAHISQKHAEKNIKNSNQISLGKSVLEGLAKNPDNKDLTAFTSAVATGLDTTYNKDQEMEADEEAIRILKKAGYAPIALKQILLKLPENGELMSKHPRTQSRLDKITELAGAIKFDENPIKQKRFLANAVF